jgi:hypothetical protein
MDLRGARSGARGAFTLEVEVPSSPRQQRREGRWPRGDRSRPA